MGPTNLALPQSWHQRMLWVTVILYLIGTVILVRWIVTSTHCPRWWDTVMMWVAIVIFAFVHLMLVLMISFAIGALFWL
jgi:hypothetical protein